MAKKAKELSELKKIREKEAKKLLMIDKKRAKLRQAKMEKRKLESEKLKIMEDIRRIKEAQERDKNEAKRKIRAELGSFKKQGVLAGSKIYKTLVRIRNMYY